MIPIMLLPWQHTSPHVSSNTNKYNSLWELAHHTKLCLCTVKTVEAFCCSRSMAPVWKLFKFKLIIPLDSNTQRRLHYFASHNMQWNCPNFALLHTKALAVLPPCVRPILQHTAVPVSPSAKPSANLLPNSFCYPTITPQAPWIPGTRPVSGTILNKRHRC